MDNPLKYWNSRRNIKNSIDESMRNRVDKFSDIVHSPGSTYVIKACEP
jgi:hypothetical protein